MFSLSSKTFFKKILEGFGWSLFFVGILWLKTLNRRFNADPSLFNSSYLGINIGLFSIVVAGIIFSIGLLYQEAKKQKLIPLIKDIKTGFFYLKYPIIGFGGDRAEPVGINDYDEYKNQYLAKQGKLGARKIIDSDLLEYKVVKKKYANNVDKYVTYEDLEQGSIIAIESLKHKVLSDIKKLNSSCYDGLEDEIANSNSVSELVNTFNKGSF